MKARKRIEGTGRRCPPCAPPPSPAEVRSGREGARGQRRGCERSEAGSSRRGRRAKPPTGPSRREEGGGRRQRRRRGRGRRGLRQTPAGRKKRRCEGMQDWRIFTKFCTEQAALAHPSAWRSASTASWSSRAHGAAKGRWHQVRAWREQPQARRQGRRALWPRRRAEVSVVAAMAFGHASPLSWSLSRPPPPRSSASLPSAAWWRRGPAGAGLHAVT
ncbi:unnamed protein product [Urochloa humidicola]